MTKKRITILLAAAAIVLLGLIIMLSRTAGMDRPTFDNQLPQELADAAYHYQILEIREFASHWTVQPLHVRLPNAIAKKLGWSAINFGRPDSETHFLIESPGKVRLQCWVYYSKTEALRVAIPYDTSTKSEAKTLRDTLTKAFPDMSITLEPSQDAPPQKP